MVATLIPPPPLFQILGRTYFYKKRGAILSLMPATALTREGGN